MKTLVFAASLLVSAAPRCGSAALSAELIEGGVPAAGGARGVAAKGAEIEWKNVAGQKGILAAPSRSYRIPDRVLPETFSTQSSRDSLVSPAPQTAAPRHAPPELPSSLSSAQGPAQPGPRSSAQGAAASSSRASAAPLSLQLVGGFSALEDNGTVVVPDVMGVAGPRHLMTTLNSEIRIQSKSGVEAGRAALGAFWSSVASAPFDPKLIFDADSGRYIFSAMDQKQSTASAVLLAVSAGDDPTGAWYLSRFDADAGRLAWADYPNLAVNKKWIVVTGNMFSIAGDVFQGSKMWVLDKSSAAASAGIAPFVFGTGFDDAGLGSAHSIHGAWTFGDEDALYMADNGWISSGGDRFVRLSRITGAAAAPVWSLLPGGGLVRVNPFGAVVDAPQLGTGAKIFARDHRICNAVFRNGSLWFTHTGGTPAGSPARDAAVWYQINPFVSPPEVIQQGLVEDSGGAASYFYPSIAVNSQSDVLLGFSGSSSSTYAGAYFAGRSSRDPRGAMQSAKPLKAGEAKYFKVDLNGVNRWGDYTATSVDPADGLSFWTLQQYAALPSGGDRWGTWWGQLSIAHDIPPRLDAVKVFPVPWKPGSGGKFDSAQVFGCGRGIIFEDIRPGSMIRLYNILGDFVRELNVAASDPGCKAWDGKNSAGRDVASGVYLAVIESAPDGRIVKKLAVER